MNLLLIIEGVDGIGKTVLIEQLEHFFWKNNSTFYWKNTTANPIILNYSHPSGYSMDTESASAQGEYLASSRIFGKLVKLGFDIICDRFHLGEYAYGPVKRNYPEWLAEKTFEIEDQLICEVGKEKIKLVLLVAMDPSIPFERSVGRKGEYLQDLAQYTEINLRYQSSVLKTKLETLVICIDGLSEQDVFEKVRSFLIGDKVEHL